MPPQFLKTNNIHKVMCGCEICISASITQCELNSWISTHIEKLISYYEIFHSRRFSEERKTILIH